MTSITFTRGKADFLVIKDIRSYIPDFKPVGELESLCLCEYNVDFGAGCINKIPPNLLPEIVENNGTYSPERLMRYKEKKEDLPDWGCTYCYAGWKNSADVGPGSLEQTPGLFRKHKPRVVRLGKKTEMGHPYYRDTLIQFLRMCKEFGTAVIFPTKDLGFDKEVAGLLRDTGSFLYFSLGYDRLERGACANGFTNEWRIKQAELYSSFGVNTSLTVVCDVISSIEDNVSRGSFIERALSSSLVSRVIPIRLNSRGVAKELGLDWDTLRRGVVDQKDLCEVSELESPPLSYLQKGNNDLVAKVLHLDFIELMRQGVGFCGRVGKMEYCDRCNLEGGRRIALPVSDIVPITEYDNKYIDRERRREKRSGQTYLFEIRKPVKRKKNLKNK